MPVYTCAPLFASINGLICPTPPDAIRLTEPEDQHFDTLSGWETFRKANGRVAEWSFGERGVTAEMVQWLRNVLDLAEPYALEWNEPADITHAWDALMEGEEFEWSWFEPGLYRPFRLLFLEVVP